MALIKVLPNDFGGETTYWKVSRINEDFFGKTEAYLAGYVDKDARDDEKNALEYRTFSFDLRDATREDVYAEIKKPIINEDGEDTNVFSDAIDC